MTQTVSTVGTEANERALRAALEQANIPSLLMALVQLTGEQRWLQPPYRPVRASGLDDNDSGGLDPEHQAEVRDAVVAAVRAHEAGVLQPLQLTPGDVARMLSVALDTYVPPEYGPLLAEELGVRSRDVEVPAVPPGFNVVIIGAGISGLGAAIKLKQAGVPFTILEKDEGVGGTWLENTYPGCGVDTPGHLYCFSFDPNVKWTRYFAKRDEVWSYLVELADKHGITEHIRFGVEVTRAAFDPTSSTWRVTARDADGAEDTVTGNVLVPAVGMVNRPSFPSIPGRETFAGPIMHTAEWDDSVDLEGRRVAVIGTGASAMQLVPSIAGTAGRISVFQRSKQWAIPHPNYQRPVDDHVRLVMEQVPFYAAWYRLRAFWNFSDRLHPQVQVDPEWPHQERSVNANNESHRIFLTNYVEEQLADRPDLIEACLPDYPPYGKRPLIDNGWFTTIKRPDVELVTDAVAEIRPDGLVTRNGEFRPADVIVFATGFRALQFLWPMDIVGLSGRTLAEQWGPNDARAYLGLTVPDFPNMFILNGPNTNAGHGGSAIIATEFQVRYLLQAISHLIDTSADSIEVRDDVFWDYNDELDEALSRSIWAHPGMTNWYRNDAGRVVISSPWTYLDYWERTLEFRPGDYREPSSEPLVEEAS
ncbi:MAG: NAD(P)/FAD-dependent oxidoreductase [Acidimicrobiaceae bacterium]|nr:NAD(P)/FAD-dependent oxidoreductase [Acidimicrobiaceae bacterium]